MLQITNRQVHEAMEWEDYLAHPSYSYSKLRHPDMVITPTPKMQLGTLVHHYLLEPGKYNGEQYKVVRPAAMAVKEILGGLKFKSEIAVTADFEVDGLVMPYKGRIDIDAGIIIDLKVSEMEIYKAVAYFRYDRQTSGYVLGRGYNKAILISINPKISKATIAAMPMVEDWWIHQVKQYGTIKNNNYADKS